MSVDLVRLAYAVVVTPRLKEHQEKEMRKVDNGYMVWVSGYPAYIGDLSLIYPLMSLVSQRGQPPNPAQKNLSN